MKYIRLYEGKKNSLQVGDYVVCDETLSNNFTLGSEVNIFLSNNVGQYIIDRKTLSFPYLIKYKNVPKRLKDVFHDDNITGCRCMKYFEIIFWSSNEDDCEAFIMARKYNI